jgi:hypothetical protein
MRSLTLASLLALSACGDPTSTLIDRSARALGILQVSAHDTNVPVVDGSYGGQVRWLPPLGFQEAVLLPPQLITAPDTVLVNQPFTVTVATIGLDGCWRPDGGTVVKQHDGVSISPYDVRSGAALCTVMSLERPLLHTFTVTLTTPGDHAIRVHGRRAISVDGQIDDPVSAERTIVAR